MKSECCRSGTGVWVDVGGIEHGVEWGLSRAAIWLLGCQCILGADMVKCSNSANCEDFGVSHYHTTAGRCCLGKGGRVLQVRVILAE